MKTPSTYLKQGRTPTQLTSHIEQFLGEEMKDQYSDMESISDCELSYTKT